MAVEPGQATPARSKEWPALERHRKKLEQEHEKLGLLHKALEAFGIDPADFGVFLLQRDKNRDDGRGEKLDPFKALTTFRARQAEEIPPRTWFLEGMITPGFNMVAARKSTGKSYLLMQMAQAIAEGRELLGRKTLQAKVLYVSFELDEADTSDRFKAMLAPLSESAYVLHAWPSGERAFKAAEQAVKEYGFKVIIFDTLLPLLPRDPKFELNEYADSDYYLKWRLLGKRCGAAIVASWHTGKNEREDFFLNPIGSTGMVAQADCLITIDRKRGHPEGKLFVGGNHAKDAVLPVIFEDGVFRLGEGEISPDRLTPDEEKTMAVLKLHPEGCTPSAVGLATGKNDHAARMALNRLIARGKVMKITRGVYGIATLLEPH